MTTHVSYFGSCGGGLYHDRAGYVATSIREVLRGDWGEPPTRAWAAEVARANRAAMREAEQRLRAWRSGEY
jgi:hypothetical protein